MRNVRDACRPRPEVLKGDLDDALFGAEFRHVVEGIAPHVYQDPETFFRNTHPAAPLRKVVTTIFRRLADPNEAGAAIRLSTGYGGGKSHTLIALWHLARHISQANLGTELLPAAGRPPRVLVAGLDGRGAGTSVFASHAGLRTHSLWGELAYQLRGEAGYAHIKDLDHPNTVPDASAVRELLPEGPLLILMDELVVYMALLDSQGQNALLAFLGSLIVEIGARRAAVLVITDPAGQPAYEKQATALANATRQLEAAQRMDDVLSRKVSDYDPIGGETAEVIVRRLFEDIDHRDAEIASAEYFSAYKRAHEEHAGVLPARAVTAEYAEGILRCYPFHPRLLETARERLGAMQDFQRGRGTLRLFARIVRDAWERQSELSLICAGDLDWASERIRADLLQRLNREHFEAAVDADVTRHAGHLDSIYSTDIHRRTASALLLESLPLTHTSGLDKRELTLAVMRPSDVGHEPGEAVDRLYRVCWHTYRDDGGQRFQFRYEPNANKIIEERSENPALLQDAHDRIRTLVQKHYAGHTFSLVAWPSSPRAVSDSRDLKLVLAESESLAQAICDYLDDSDPNARFPRPFRNAILGIAPAPAALETAVQAMRRFLAAEEVYKEQRKGSPLRAQLDEMRPNLHRDAYLAAIQAYSRLVFPGKEAVTLPERYQVPREGALAGGANGQALLKEYLDAKEYIYAPTDAIDVPLLLDRVMSGATPSLEHEGAYPASAVHERALSSTSLRLMRDEGPVRNAILRAVDEGLLVVRQPDGDVFDAEGCVAGPAGRRQRTSHKLSTLKLNYDVLLAPAGAPCVSDWTHIDAPEEPDGDELLSIDGAALRKGATSDAVLDALNLGLLRSVFSGGVTMIAVDRAFHVWQPDHTPSQATASSWKEALDYARRRPLRSLKLSAGELPVAERLLAAAQPFGARSLTFSVTLSGTLKEGGVVNFKVSNLPHNSPLKPLETARLLSRAAAEDAFFHAEIALDFASAEQRAPHVPLERAYDTLRGAAGIWAEFGPEDGGESADV